MVVNVPNLRFPGFEGEWQNNVLGEICKMQAGKFVSASEIHEKPEDKLFPCYGGNGLRGYTRSYNQNGIYSLIGRQGALCGNITLVRGKFHATEHAVVVTPSDSIDAIWMFYLLMYLNLNQYATGAAQPGLSVQNLENVETIIPKSKDEQQKISSFLNLIDQRIQTQNKIIENLETLIKGLSERLFDQKLKFGGFSKSWNTYKVSEFLEFFPTNSLSWENLEYENGDLFNLHYGLIHQGIPTQIDLAEDSLPNIKNESLPTSYTLCKEGDIVFADASEDTNDIAKVVEFINCNERNIICGLHTIHGRDKLNLTVKGFKCYAFSTKQFRNQIRQLAQGTKVYAISSKTFKECYINVPSKDEQSKIARILTLIDKKIAIEKKMLHQLEKQKNSLLKGLFI